MNFIVTGYFREWEMYVYNESEGGVDDNDIVATQAFVVWAFVEIINRTVKRGQVGRFVCRLLKRTKLKPRLRECNAQSLIVCYMRN